MMFGRAPRIITPAEALPGRMESITVIEPHHVLGTSINPPFAEASEVAVFAEGCFWGVERVFWQIPGVITTAVGYVGGFTPNPTCQEVCSGRTGHTEGVLVEFDPTKVSYEELLTAFWESHDPTQGMRQGNDIGTQYRSGVYTLNEEQLGAATASRERFQTVLTAARFDEITTEITAIDGLSDHWFYAEDYHQQYLSKNPGGYCGLGSTGMSCPVGVARESD